MKSSKSIVLNKGDVIKTNPQNGYWGCALVLDVQEHNDEVWAGSDRTHRELSL